MRGALSSVIIMEGKFRRYWVKWEVQVKMKLVLAKENC